tara:strand:+ start:523 stop:837 length:315 start_codon:yes stop_codon:yes gene_type:complete
MTNQKHLKILVLSLFIVSCAEYDSIEGCVIGELQKFQTEKSFLMQQEQVRNYCLKKMRSESCYTFLNSEEYRLRLKAVDNGEIPKEVVDMATLSYCKLVKGEYR